jgi:hypothetical protein
VVKPAGKLKRIFGKQTTAHLTLLSHINEKALAVLEAALENDPTGATHLAYLDALRSTPAWTPLAVARQQAAGNPQELKSLNARFGNANRAGKAWNLILSGYVKNAAWAKPQLERLSRNDSVDRIYSCDFGVHA